MTKQIESYSHSQSKRKNIPTEQMQNFVSKETKEPIPVEYLRRNPDLDPQLIWKGKYECRDILSIGAKPLYIQEKIHPKAIIENLRKKARKQQRPHCFLKIYLKCRQKLIEWSFTNTIKTGRIE